MPSSVATSLFLFAFLLAIVGSPITAVIFGVVGVVVEVGMFIATAIVPD